MLFGWKRWSYAYDYEDITTCVAQMTSELRNKVVRFCLTKLLQLIMTILIVLELSIIINYHSLGVEIVELDSSVPELAATIIFVFESITVPSPDVFIFCILSHHRQIHQF